MALVALNMLGRLALGPTIDAFAPVSGNACPVDSVCVSRGSTYSGVSGRDNSGHPLLFMMYSQFFFAMFIVAGFDPRASVTFFLERTVLSTKPSVSTTSLDGFRWSPLQVVSREGHETGHVACPLADHSRHPLRP